MKDLIEVTSNERLTLTSIAEKLEVLSNAFYITGNKDMSYKLSTLAGEIVASADRFNNAVGRALDETYKNSVQSSVNMVNAALAGITIGKSEG